VKKWLPGHVIICLPDDVKNSLPGHVKNCLPRRVKNSLPCGGKIILPPTPEEADAAAPQRARCFQDGLHRDLKIKPQTPYRETGQRRPSFSYRSRIAAAVFIFCHKGRRFLCKGNPQRCVNRISGIFYLLKK